METTVMPAAASVQKQQGLNQVVINKVQRMIESIHSFPTRRSSDESEERRVGKECTKWSRA